MPASGEGILSAYPVLTSIPKLAAYKALILNLGVNFDYKDSKKDGMEDSKVKYRNKKHLVRNRELIDSSKDPSIIPSEIILSTDSRKTLTKISYKPNSPIKMVIENNRFYLIDSTRDEKLDVEVKSVSERDYSRLKMPPGRVAQAGTPLGDYIQILGLDRLGVLAYSGCEHWLDGKMCKFCDENPKRNTDKSAMPTINSLIDFNDNIGAWWKIYGIPYIDGVAYTYDTILKTERIEPHMHLQLMAGNLVDTRSEWDICLEIGKRLNDVKPLSEVDSYFNIAGPPKDLKDFYITRVKNLGFKTIAFNLEVIGNAAYKDVCPGKSLLASYDDMVDVLKTSVYHFGHGNVRSNFVLGAQPIDELLDGIRELADAGIVSDYSVFIPKKCTPWEGRISPDMETVVDFTKKLAEIYMSHGFHGIYCNMSSRSNILHEIMDNK